VPEVAERVIVDELELRAGYLAAFEGTDAMRRVIRYVLVVAGITAMVTMESSATALAAIAPPTTDPTVATIQPADGDVVGVAQPIVVRFTKPVADRAAAERTVAIISSNKPTGQVQWLNNHVVQWIPDGFWPAHTQVTVKAGPVSTEFQTGAAVVAVADISAHTFTVSIDDQVVREIPASMGKPRYPTPVGTFAALAKERSVVFDSRTIGIPLDDPEGYRIDGEYAVRVTWGGVYVHSAPWSVASQGNANVSHGCINLSPENAAWYFDTVHVGDPVIVQE
jgi:lipoprotein-anchoring transpeptidase ErfK/SrfK